ncbi:hypothetical protein F4V43_02575 [Paenibacillus spiritus]|uniref:Uncharacterized protein n=1 Tax=Paenibacillus spiritus TaxID=2496557 RepID=A0A5J5GI68_9BACL|nr:hypothetical protein [Paenibacillus spiritus]KAA9007392.1 hypothetical protein F4V43_02575 [Paenibacillus spiritus]
MKAEIYGIEVEGTPEEIALFKTELDKQNRNPSKEVNDILKMILSEKDDFKAYPPYFITPSINPIIYAQVWCGGFLDSGSVTCKQDSNAQMYN